MRQIKNQSGVALVVALGVMTVMLALVGLAAEAAIQLSTTSNNDTNYKRALEAAEAGLQVANYRITMLKPADANCVANSVVAPTNGYCGPVTQSLGNGASFTFYTTPALSSSDACSGLPLKNQLALSQRCVTSTGTVNGVSRRLQIRVAAYASTPLFPVNGVIGKQAVTLAPNAQMTAVAGTNGSLSMGNNSSLTSAVLGPSASTPTIGNGATLGSQTKRTTAQGPFVLSPVDPGNSATVNDNQRILNGQATPTVSPYDTSSGITYTASTRSLNTNNGASLTLTGTTYNFCSFTTGNNATITVPAGNRVRIFIDSPDDPNSSCPAGSGTITMANNSSFTGPSGDSTALQIYVYGTSDGNNVATIRNNATFWGTIYAPQSTVNLQNNGQINGAIAGNIVNLNNNGSFTWDANAGTLQAGTTGISYRTAWSECPAQPTVAGNPGSGC